MLRIAPPLPLFTLGHDCVPPSIHPGGLRYHGASPIISSLVKSGRMEAVAYPQGKTFEAAIQFARTEGKIPAPETGHAIRAVIDEAPLRDSGLVKGRHDGIKILGNGKLTKKLTVSAVKFSETARKHIEAAGGTCQEIQ